MQSLITHLVSRHRGISRTLPVGLRIVEPPRTSRVRKMSGDDTQSDYDERRLDAARASERMATRRRIQSLEAEIVVLRRLLGDSTDLVHVLWAAVFGLIVILALSWWL